MRLTLSLLFVCVLSACGSTDNPPLPHPDLGPDVDANGVDLGGGGMDLGGTDGAAPIDAPLDDGAVSTDGAASDASLDLGAVSMPCMATGACDPFAADSCAAGFSCRPNISMRTECQAIAPDAKVEGAVCTSGGDCQPGLLCLDFGTGLTCNRMCPQGSLGFCGGEDRCFGTIGDVCVQVCRPRPEPCNIYLQDCPRSADACAFATDPETREPYTGCRLAGTAAHGAACGGTDGACARGLVCIRTAGVSTCKQVCGPDGGTPACTFAGETCSGFARTWGVPYCLAP